MKKFIFFMCLPLLVLATGCFKGTKKEQPMKTVTAEELKEKMAKNPNLTVVNVLSEKSYNDCKIKGSINAPVAQLTELSKQWDKNQEIVVYCASYTCHASKSAYNVLKNLGFTNIMSYEGGMKEWHEKKFETEGLCQAGYLNPAKKD